MRINLPPGRIEAINITLTEMLMSFSGFSGRVEGAPKWAETDRYDLIAKADREIKREELGPMFMVALEDRFKLKVHHENKEEEGLAIQHAPQLPPVPNAEGSINLSDTHFLVFKGVSMPRLAIYLRSMWSMPVTDKTGLTGNFDFTAEPDTYGNAGDVFRDRIRAALEAIGFSFAPVTVQRDVTVIEHAERPTPN